MRPESVYDLVARPGYEESEIIDVEQVAFSLSGNRRWARQHFLEALGLISGLKKIPAGIARKELALTLVWNLFQARGSVDPRLRLQPFFLLSAEARLILSLLATLKLSYVRIGRVIKRDAASVGRLAREAREQLWQSAPSPAFFIPRPGKAELLEDCYLFLDEALTGERLHHFQNLAFANAEVGHLLSQAREIVFYAEAKMGEALLEVREARVASSEVAGGWLGGTMRRAVRSVRGMSPGQFILMGLSAGFSFYFFTRSGGNTRKNVSCMSTREGRAVFASPAKLIG